MEIRGDTNTGKIVTKVTNISFKKLTFVSYKLPFYRNTGVEVTPRRRIASFFPRLVDGWTRFGVVEFGRL